MNNDAEGNIAKNNTVYINEEAITKALTLALRDIFGENIASGRFIDVSRIPLICKSIIDMHQSIEKINDNITWIVRLIIGGVVLGILALIIKR